MALCDFIGPKQAKVILARRQFVSKLKTLPPVTINVENGRTNQSETRGNVTSAPDMSVPLATHGSFTRTHWRAVVRLHLTCAQRG
jgi:hypothetical protein